MEETARLEKFEITDSRLEHNNCTSLPKGYQSYALLTFLVGAFPSTLKTRELRKLAEEDFLINHKIDRSYDDSTVRFKLLWVVPSPLPSPPALLMIVAGLATL